MDNIYISENGPINQKGKIRELTDKIHDNIWEDRTGKYKSGNERYRDEQIELEKLGLTDYEDIGVLPIKNDNESLEEFSDRVQRFIEDNNGPKWMEESSWVEKHLVLAVSEEYIPEVLTFRRELDAICNAYANLGKDVVYYSMDTWTKGGIKCPKRNKGESIEEWSERLDDFCHEINDKENRLREARKESNALDEYFNDEGWED